MHRCAQIKWSSKPKAQPRTTKPNSSKDRRATVLPVPRTQTVSSQTLPTNSSSNSACSTFKCSTDSRAIATSNQLVATRPHKHPLLGNLWIARTLPPLQPSSNPTCNNSSSPINCLRTLFNSSLRLNSLQLSNSVWTPHRIQILAPTTATITLGAPVAHPIRFIQMRTLANFLHQEGAAQKACTSSLTRRALGLL